TTKVNINYDENMMEIGDTLPIKAYAFLGNILKSPELKFIFEWLGFCMVKGYPLQKLLILQGSGGNGKSTLINFISSIIGAENTSNLSLDTLQNDRFGKAHLKGKMLNACADISDTFFESMATIKEITGDDKSYAEFKGQNGFSFLNFAKLIFSANTLPSFKDTSEGLTRRLILLPMNMKPEPIDVKLNDILGDSKELTRILLHSIESFERALQNGRFSISEEMEQALSQWLEKIDNLACFVSDECILKPGVKVKKTTLFKEYRYYCADNNYKDVGRNKFYERISARYNLGESKSTGDMYFTGIGLKTDI
ncbi:DNA primase family protein, partial [Streptomyces sp. NPDC055080]